MNGHMAKAVRAKTGWSRWSAWCPAGCTLDHAESKEHAEYLADEHYRKTCCFCYDQETLEWLPEACDNCKERAMPEGGAA